jgi:hypothetical protein
MPGRYAEGTLLADDKYFHLVGTELFGRSLRLRVVRWLLQQPSLLVTQGEVAKAMDEKTTEAGKELDRLVALGMMDKHDRARGNSPQEYTRLDSHPLWGVLQQVVDTVEDLEPRRVSELPTRSPGRIAAAGRTKYKP